MYSSLSDIRKIIPERTIAQLTDDTAGANVDQDNLDEAIMAADEVIDTYLRGRYELPFDETPPILKRLSAEITIFHLYGRRPEGELPETISVKYKAAIKMLESFRDGKLVLGDDGGEEIPDAGSYRSTPKTRVFT